MKETNEAVLAVAPQPAVRYCQPGRHADGWAAAIGVHTSCALRGPAGVVAAPWQRVENWAPFSIAWSPSSAAMLGFASQLSSLQLSGSPASMAAAGLLSGGG